MTLTSATGGQPSGTQTATITILNIDEPAPEPETSALVYLPVAAQKSVLAPDLVVQAVEINGSDLSIVIENQGLRPVQDSFWVDLIVNPQQPPSQPNDTAGSLGALGLVWGVDEPDLSIEPGARLTLTVNGEYYIDGLSTFSGEISTGTPIYVHVDSANLSTTYGAVRESHELLNTTYNNIFMLITSRDHQIQAYTELRSRTAADFIRLPNRPDRK